MVAKVTVEISASNICSGIVSDGITINSNKSLTVALWGFIRMMLPEWLRCLLLMSSHGDETHGGCIHVTDFC